MILYLTFSVFCLSTSQFFLLMLIIEHRQLMHPKNGLNFVCFGRVCCMGTISLEDYGKIEPSCRFTLTGLQGACIYITENRYS